VPNQQRMVAVVIAVSDAKPLKYLGAALNAARDFEAWARAMGYQTKLVTDEQPNDPVTVDRLASELNALLSAPNSKRIDRFILYFAGHGLIQEAEEGLWLVSDWHTSARAIAVNLLKRRLFTFDLGQISIFSDACRLLPSNFEAAELTRDGVIGYGPEPLATNRRKPPVDTFIAAQDYGAAFAVPGPSPQEDRCIFTGVTLSALWGADPLAFSKAQPNYVVSRSLGAYVEQEVQRVAALYDLQLLPTIVPTFPEGEDIYYKAGTLAPPNFPEWPPRETILSPQGFAPKPISGARRAREFTVDSNVEIGEPTAEGARRERPSARFSVADQLQKLRYRAGQLGELGSGLAMAGDRVERLWIPPTIIAECVRGGELCHFSREAGRQLPHPVPVLVELKRGEFAALNVLPDFLSAIVCDARGVSGLVYYPRDAALDSGIRTELVIEELEKGALRFSDAANFPMVHRNLKGIDPILGVISAYLYDSIGDVESIRALAYFYSYYSQSIPYDVALLAQLHGSWDQFILRVDIPEVSEREARTEAERKQPWTHGGTPAVQGVTVAGAWPWMRQGWPYLDDPSDIDSSLVLSQIRNLRRHLLPSRFATVDTAGGHALVELLGLVSYTPPESEPINSPIARSS
jgi:hypothetical protein